MSASGASSIFSQSGSFGDPMSAPGSGPASLQTQNSGMFGPGPTQQQFQQQPQQQQRPMVSPMNELIICSQKLFPAGWCSSQGIRPGFSFH